MGRRAWLPLGFTSLLACQPCLLADCPSPLVVTIEHSAGLGEQDYLINILLDAELVTFDCWREQEAWACDGPSSWEPYSDDYALSFELSRGPAEATELPITVTVIPSQTEGFSHQSQVSFYESYVASENWRGDECSKSCILADELYLQL